MRTFVWVMLVLQCVSLGMNLIQLGRGKAPENSMGGIAFSTAITIGIIVWACVLLFAKAF